MSRWGARCCNRSASIAATAATRNQCSYSADLQNRCAATAGTTAGCANPTRVAALATSKSDGANSTCATTGITNC
jgi:hypothetical protein